MFYFGAYKVENYKNITSIPEVINVKQEKNNGIVYVISDSMFTRENSNINEKEILFSKKLFSSIIKQKQVFDNIEAIVLNGNILRNVHSIQNTLVTNNGEFSYSFLHSLISISLNIPIYYVRGSYDCYINNTLLPSDIRGRINFCNCLVIGQTMFFHGHSSLPFISDNNCAIINSLHERQEQEENIKNFSNDVELNFVLSNSNYVTYKNKNVINIGSFSLNGYSVISLTPFNVSGLTVTT